MSTSLNTLSVSDLRKAANLKEQIEALERELSDLIGNGSPAPAVKGKKGGMSDAGKARIIAAQKARWAKVKASKPSPSPAKAAAAPKKKGGISPEGLARIKAAQKARWAKFKKAKA